MFRPAEKALLALTAHHWFSPCPKVIKDHPVCPVIEGNILQLESEKPPFATH